MDKPVCPFCMAEALPFTVDRLNRYECGTINEPDILDKTRGAKCYRNEIAQLKDELETEKMRLAACGVAALGYFDGCDEKYKSASLDDCLRLYEKYEQLIERLEAWRECWPELEQYLFENPGELQDRLEKLKALGEVK